MATIDKYLKVRKGVDTPDVLTSSATVHDYFKTPVVIFDTTHSTSSGLGILSWNSSEGTLDLGISNNKNIHIGEDSVYRVRNSTESTILKGTALYASGVEPSGRIQVSPYVADGSIREVRFMGLATENINSGVNGFVQHFGYVKDLDTRGTSSTSISVGDEDWSAGDILYVHPTQPGKLTNIKPQHAIIVALLIIRNQTSGVLFVRPSSAGHIEDIHDILITSASNNNILSYSSASSLWVNKSLLNAIKEVDGAGSGVDADLLDGYNSDYFAPVASPTFTGIPTAPTASAGTNSTQIATTAFVYSMLTGIDGGAPSSTYEFTIDGGGA